MLRLIAVVTAHGINVEVCWCTLEPAQDLGMVMLLLARQIPHITNSKECTSAARCRAVAVAAGAAASAAVAAGSAAAPAPTCSRKAEPLMPLLFPLHSQGHARHAAISGPVKCTHLRLTAIYRCNVYRRNPAPALRGQRRQVQQRSRQRAFRRRHRRRPAAACAARTAAAAPLPRHGRDG